MRRRPLFVGALLLAAWRYVPASMVLAMVIAAAIALLARRQASLATALRRAVRNGEFFLVYQPVVELPSGRPVGVEALLRWRRPDGTLIGPDLFIPLAEEMGVITQLTELVFVMVEQDTRDFLAGHPDFHVAINLSAQDLQSDAILGLVDALLARGSAKDSNLVVEITERGILDFETARPIIEALRARGIAIAIDDFGTGYAGLSCLESLPVDMLKIDKSFIDGIGTSAPTNEVVNHIITMAAAMRLTVIGEGVETAAQANYLDARGVQLAQGWRFGKPQRFADAVSTMVGPVRRETLRAVLDSALSCRAAPAGEQAAQPQAGDGDLVGHSEAMREVHKRIGLAAASALPLLVLGETGTGKGVVARALHRYSARAARPFIAVNCAAIPGELLESELFGHVRGAFTGATSEREGCFRAADGGVLLLDEIGDMPLDVQAKILRRTAAAGPAKRLAADAEACLLRQAWPGDARELRNAMERSHALFRHEVIGAADLASILDAPSFFSAPASTPALPEDWLTQPLPLAIERLERRMLEHALVEAQGNRAEAARRLGIHRQLLYRKLAQYGIDG